MTPKGRLRIPPTGEPRLILQELLAERFKLVVDREKKEVPPSPPKTGPKLPPVPAVFTMRHEQRGLRLEARKETVEVFVIDRIEKPSK